jgi:carbonic anhydrase
MAPIEIRHALGESEVAEVRRLLEEYAAWIAVDLSFQNFADEMRGLPGEYALPGGALFLGRAGASVAGCVAVRRIDHENCEMKRLFVRDSFRGLGAGEALARQALEWAKEAGYASMRLDTLPSMGAAHKLYERLGFKEVPAYRFNPVPGARFLALHL